MQSILILVGLASLVLGDSVVDPLRRQPKCPGGYEEGAEAVLGRYYYKCQSGYLEPMGCIDDRGNRVPLWQTTDSQSQDYRFECVRDSQGDLQFEYKSCLFQGRPYQVNQRWADDKYVYICLQQGDYMRQEVDGCVDAGREVGINEKVKKGDFLFQCKHNENGTCSMCPIGCVKTDREYLTGDTFDDGKYWYSCEKVDGRITMKANGCVFQTKRFGDNEHFFRNNVAYECQVDKDKVTEKVIGCAVQDEQGQTIEKQLGATWTEGQYDVQCKYDQATDRTTKVQTRCVHTLSTGSPLVLEPGCYQIQDNQAIGCWKDPSSSQLQIKKMRVDDIGLPVSDGLRFC